MVVDEKRHILGEEGGDEDCREDTISGEYNWTLGGKSDGVDAEYDIWAGEEEIVADSEEGDM